MARMLSYNLFNYGASQDINETRRRDRLHAQIRALQPDVLAVQEIWADGDDKAARASTLVHELADATGLTCDLPDGQTSVAIGNLPFHTALLWAPGIEATGWRECSGTQLFHSLGRADLTIDSQLIRYASFHATPFGRYRRADEAERVVSLMNRPDDRPPGLIGADFNCVHADLQPGGEWYYDHNPLSHIDVDWHPDFIHQCEWWRHDGALRFRATRETGEVLVAGGLVDAAAHLEAEWQRTCGHWPTGDPYPDRRIDAIKATADLLPALRAYHVEDTAETTSISDHLPVVVDYDPTAIR